MQRRAEPVPGFFHVGNGPDHRVRAEGRARLDPNDRRQALGKYKRAANLLLAGDGCR